MSAPLMFTCRRLDLEHRLLEVSGPDFDFDSFADVAGRLLAQLDMTVREKELNADLHVWLVDFEGCRLMLKGEHYSGQMWLEGLDGESDDTLVYLAQLLGSDNALGK
ncbi:DUF3630 domain-containing protein [Photobacterium sanctipauli]|uniref:DUF3630 domain-containing protein n=1 Tax=Photobacterium sanctipauli TaxID=1342794 RepID=A0A2T3NEX2_9GAMM|nr:DUF3630 family protein [Photobacterium sanctipauli]PSW13092.1 DUF3630 domain-containing protein [Photobacterium sanctipauli]